MCGFASAFFSFLFCATTAVPYLCIIHCSCCYTSDVEGKANARANTQEWKKEKEKEYRADGWKVLATACAHIHQRNDRWNNVKKYSLAFRLGNGIGNGELVSSVASCVVYLKLFSAKGIIGYFYWFCFLCVWLKLKKIDSSKERTGETEVCLRYILFSSHFFRFFAVVFRAGRFSIWSLLENATCCVSADRVAVAREWTNKISNKYTGELWQNYFNRFSFLISLFHSISFHSFSIYFWLCAFR